MNHPLPTPTAPIKLIVTDVDGTLLNSHHELTPRTLAAVQNAQAAGIPVVLATGRPRIAKSVELIEALALTAPGIFLQGGMIHDPDGTIRHKETHPPELVADILALTERENFTAVLYCGLEILVKQNNHHTRMLNSFNEALYQEIGDLSRYAVPDFVNKIIVLSEPENIPTIRATLDSYLGGRARLVQTLPMAIEVLPNTVSKGVALEWLIAEMGITADNVIAFGDAENDVEMLQVAGIGIAMENAMPVAKAAANYIAPSNDDDGVAQVIEQLVLA